MNTLRTIIRNLPLPKRVKHFLLTPPGHFHSPIPSLREIKEYEDTIFSAPSKHLPGIDLNVEEQLRMLDELKQFYPTLPFGEHKQDNLRYYYENEAYSYADAIMLFCMIRHLKPKRIIEVGSGFSSCVTLDTNELFFDNRISCTFIDPYPQQLFTRIRHEDRERIIFLPKKLQEVSLETFSRLEANDILFIDSTHVSKIHSDVNYLLFDILPSLQRGVYIHIHDIMYPFEYPPKWIFDGIAWNEAYILRAFLQYNNSFKIMLFNSYLAQFYRETLESQMPLCLKNPGGSIWLRKV